MNPNAVGSPRGSTQVNANALPFVQPTQGNHELYVGQIIGEKYKVVSRINVESGEADLYACTDSNDTQYCLKIYHRREQISQEVHARLQHIRAPYIANLVAWGDFNGKLYEVWPLYSRGSLAGQRFDEQSIKPYIAQMNERALLGEVVSETDYHALCNQLIEASTVLSQDNQNRQWLKGRLNDTLIDLKYSAGLSNELSESIARKLCERSKKLDENHINMNSAF